jgi:hypothetical protein
MLKPSERTPQRHPDREISITSADAKPHNTTDKTLKEPYKLETRSNEPAPKNRYINVVFAQSQSRHTVQEVNVPCKKSDVASNGISLIRG